MSKSFSKICQNCTTEYESSFQYCPNCGQKNTDGKITISELWSEFQDAIFNVDSRTWRTLKNLFIPGRLTVEYFSGKRRRYVHPLRLLIVTSLLAIIAMSFQDFQSTTNHGYDVVERMQKNHERQRLYRIVNKITDGTNAIFPAQQTKIITDTILTAFQDSLQNLLFESDNQAANKYGDRYGDSIDLNYYASFGSERIEKVSKHDFLYLDEDELTAVYKEDASVFERLFFKQKIKFIKNESQLFAAIVGHTTWAILLLMPGLALVLYGLYIRHRFFYVEHLIFAFHLQSFSFIVLTVLIAGLYVFPWWVFLMMVVVIGIYGFLSMRRVYQQSLGKTLLKFFCLGVSYVSLFLLILIGTVFVSFLLL